MKYLKMLGLAAIAAGALMAFAGAGTASATELTCTNPLGTKVMCETGSVLKSESEGHAVLDSLIGNVECVSTVESKQLNTGSSTETVKGEITALTFTGCTRAAVVTVLAKGTLEIHTDPADPVGSEGKTGNGTLTSTGTEVTVEQSGFHCIFKTKETDIGTLTGASTATVENANHELVFTHMATLDISATIPRTGGRSGAFCGSSAPWTGSYTVTSAGPAAGNNGWLDVDHHE